MWGYVILLILMLVLYLYAKYDRVCSDDISFEGFNTMSTLMIADVKTFSQAYSRNAKLFSEPRLDKSNEYTRIFLIMRDAMNKGKRIVSYRDIPNSPKMYSAFSALIASPDNFFSLLSAQSTKSKADTVSFLGNQSNVSNLGLQIVNDVNKHDKAKYSPTPPVQSWTLIDRSRGAH